MNLKDLEKRISECGRCGKNRFWYFPTCKGVDGFFGDKECIFVCSQPHEGDFNPSVIRFDKRFYDNIANYGFGKAHLTDMVKCRGEKYKELERWQVSNCIGWLKVEIQIVKPKAIVAVGSKSFRALSEANVFKPVLSINHYSDRFVNDEDYEKQFKRLRDCLDSGKFEHGTKIRGLITHKQLEPERREFQDLITLLNRLKANRKISSEEWREYSDQWRKSPRSRDIMMQRLKSM